MSLNDPSNNSWYTDTGATAHLHPKESILKTYSDSMSCSSVLVSDGSKIVVSNMDDTDLSFSNPYRPLSLKMSSLLRISLKILFSCVALLMTVHVELNLILLVFYEGSSDQTHFFAM